MGERKNLEPALREVKIDLYRVMESEIRSLLGICYSIFIFYAEIQFDFNAVNWLLVYIAVSIGSCVCSLKLEVLAAPCRL